MASAKKNPRRERVVIVEATYTLELSQKEAEFLRSVLSAVGGDPVDSPRKYENAIADALTGAGIPDYMNTDAYDLQRGSIMFDNYPSPF